MVDHNYEIQSFLQRYKLKLKCKFCHNPLIFKALEETDSVDDNRLYCPECHVYEDTLLALRRRLE